MPLIASADTNRNKFEEDVVGNKADTATQTIGTTASIIAMLKGVLNALLGSVGVVSWPTATKAGSGVSMAAALAYVEQIQGRPRVLTGTADIDVSAANYTADYVTLLTIAPSSGEPLLECVVDLDLNKATTGLHAVQDAADTADFVVMTKIDGTNARGALTGSQVTISDTPTANATGLRLKLGQIDVTGTAIIAVKLSAERDDVEIPYRVTYRGATPTITPFAAG